MDTSEERQLLEQCWQVLNGHGVQVEDVSSQPLGPSANCRATLVGNGSRREYAVIVRAALNTSDIARVEQARRSSELPTLIVTPYVTRGRARLFEHSAQEYVDAAGNVNLSLRRLRVKVQGEPPAKGFAPSKSRLRGNVWGEALIRGVFPILMQGIESGDWALPLSVTWLARSGRLSMGAASKVRRVLIDRGHVERRTARCSQVLDAKRLLTEWVAAYSDRFYPCRLLDRIWVKHTDLDGVWGSESAVQRLTGALEPGVETLYIDEELSRWRFRHAAAISREHAGRELELRSVFWEPPQEKADVAPALLVYADLTASGEGRNLEVREEIYERFLRQAFDQH